MAARRLIAVLLVLLVVSSLAAALAPEARRVDSTSSSSTTSTDSTAPDDTTSAPDPTGPEADAGDEPAQAPGGTLIERTISSDGPPQPAKGKGEGEGKGGPPTVAAAVGDRVALEVESKETTSIEIPDLGLLETAAPGAPARFDLLMRDPGSYPVRVMDGAIVATIEVSEPEAGGTKKQAGPAQKNAPGAQSPA
jgi:hypothetical protein